VKIEAILLQKKFELSN